MDKQISEDILRDAVAAHPRLRGIALRYFNPIGSHPSALTSFTLNPGLGLFSLLASQTQMFSSILWQFSYSLANTYSYLPFDHFLYCNMAFLAAASVLLTALAALNLRARKPRAPKGSKRA